jgi:hypothetical protein
VYVVAGELRLVADHHEWHRYEDWRGDGQLQRRRQHGDGCTIGNDHGEFRDVYLDPEWRVLVRRLALESGLQSIGGQRKRKRVRRERLRVDGDAQRVVDHHPERFDEWHGQRNRAIPGFCEQRLVGASWNADRRGSPGIDHPVGRDSSERSGGPAHPYGSMRPD